MDGLRRERLREAIAVRGDAPRAERWAQRVCVAGVEALDSVDAGILALRGTRRAQEVIGASDAWASEVAVLQYTVGEGPGVEAFTSGGPVLVADIAVDQERWPGFAHSALALGVGGMFSFPLQVGAIRLGTLEFVRHVGGGLTARQLNDATLISLLVTNGLLRHAGEAEDAGLEFAPRPVTSFQDVNVATGMLAAQLRISLDDAFSRLRAYAYSRERPLPEVAREVVERFIPLDELAE